MFCAFILLFLKCVQFRITILLLSHYRYYTNIRFKTTWIIEICLIYKLVLESSRNILTVFLFQQMLLYALKWHLKNWYWCSSVIQLAVLKFNFESWMSYWLSFVSGGLLFYEHRLCGILMPCIVKTLFRYHLNKFHSINARFCQ